MSNDMQTKPASNYEQAIQQLNKSERGRCTLQLIRDAADNGPLMSLDHYNKSAVIGLLIGLWGPECGTALDELRSATSDPE